MVELSDTDPSALVASASRREAIHAIAGYDWQRWLTVLAWLGLEKEESLWIEWAEDFTVLLPSEVGFTVQAKHRARAITLGQAGIQQIIGAAWERPASVRTLVWTSAAAGLERGAPFPEPGIIHWTAVAEGRLPSVALRQFLLDAKTLSETVKRKVAFSDDTQFRQMLRQIEWVVGEADGAGLRGKVHAMVEERMKAMAIRNASLSRQATAALLFDAVAQRSVKADVSSRRLTRGGLDQMLARWHRERLDGAAPEILAKLGAERLALQRVDRIGARAATPWSFTWFVFASQTIRLIGRDVELAEINRFANDPAQFLWWAVGGAGGLGKSRLAHEAMLRLDNSWIAGFARVDQLLQLREDLSLQSSNMMIVIDYAAVDAKTVSDFLLRCERLASTTRKIRVLLIDRDPGQRREWWRSLFEPLSSQAAILECAMHREPLYLGPLLNEGRLLLGAWLDAAGETVQPDPDAWEKIAALCAGNPLLLGFAAAGLARGDSNFDSIGDLLRGLSEREWRKMRACAGSEVAMQVAINISMTATITRQPLSECDDHDSLTIYTDGDEGVRIAFIKASNGKYRLPTFADLEEWQTTEGPLYDMLAEHHRMRQMIADLVAPHSIADAFACAYDLLGPELQIQPDLLGEFMMADCLGTAPSQLRPRVVPSIDDAQLDRIVRASWSIAPFETVFTLEQLRQHPWSVSAFLRIAGSLAQSVERGDSARAVDRLAKCLYNATIEIGGTRTPIATRQQIYDLFNSLARARPDDAGVLRPRSHALKQVINGLSGAARDAACRTYLADTSALLPILAGEEHMEVYILAVVVGFGRAAISRLASADVLLSMATLDGVLHAFPDVAEVVALASDMYFAISVACAAPTVPLGEDQPATLEFANAVLPTLLASVERFGSSCTQDHPDLRVTVAMTLVNASLAKIKLKEFEPVELLVHTVLAITDGNQEAGHRIIALNALKNYAVFAMLKDDVGTLEKALEFAFLNARPAIHDNYIAETLLEIIGNTMAFSQTGVRPVAPMLLAKVLDVPWPIDYLRVRQLLFGTVRNLLSSAKTELVELAIAEARANNVSPVVADFLEATWTRFDPRQPEDGPNGLITYIDALRRAALGDALALPFASAVAEFWFFHRRTPTLANSPLPFSVLPEVDGVRIQLGEDHIGPDCWFFFGLRTDLNL